MVQYHQNIDYLLFVMNEFRQKVVVKEEVVVKEVVVVKMVVTAGMVEMVVEKEVDGAVGD